MVTLSKKLQLWFTNIPANFQKWRYKKSFKKACKHADHVKRSTGHKCIVVFVDDHYQFKAFTKRSIKALCQSKYFRKGTTVQMIENMAVYTTN